MQIMQTNHAIVITLQEAEPILNMIHVNNPLYIKAKIPIKLSETQHIIETKKQSKIKLSHTQQMVHRIHKHGKINY